MNRVDNYFKLTIFTQEDFTDNRIVSFMKKNEQFSFEEYSNFINSISIENKISESLLNFITTYQNGRLFPDKCNAYEPVNEPFHSLKISEVIKWISQPGGAFYFKRNKTNCKYEGYIENKRFSPIWTDKKATKLLVPEISQPKTLGEMKFWFDKKDLIKHNEDVSFLEQLVVNIERVIKTENYLITE
jgi:hypothetical protein